MIAENAVLGSILKEPYLIKEIDLKPEQLDGAVNRNILQVMRKLESENKPIDVIGMLSAVNPEHVGGAGYLQQLQALANPSNFDDHVDIVVNQWKEREKRNILNNSTDEEVESIIKKLDALNTNKATDRNKLNDLLAGVYEAPWEESESSKGVPTGLHPVDRITGGWQNSDLVIVAARPSMGKTDVMLTYAKHAGWHGYLPIVFSLEMPARRLRDRLIASTGNIDRGKFKDLKKFLSDEEKARYQDAVNNLTLANIEIFDSAGQTVTDMRVKIRRLLSEYPKKKPFILIDYLTLIKPTELYNGNNHLQVSAISKSLKALAKEFDCPVVALAQLSRAVEQRSDKRPMLSDLRESGGIEEDADVVQFIYRDSYYTMDNEDHKMELIFAKHRNGETGRVVVHYNKTTGSVEM